jgi:hypothetical protein
MNQRNRVESRTPAIPTTFLKAKPVSLRTTMEITSRGFVTTMTTAFGARRAISRAACAAMPTFVFSRSIRSMPGFRAIPAVITTTSLPAISAKSVVPRMRTSYPRSGAAWRKSSALELARPLTTSTITMSAMFFSAM